MCGLPSGDIKPCNTESSTRSGISVAGQEISIDMSVLRNSTSPRGAFAYLPFGGNATVGSFFGSGPSVFTFDFKYDESFASAGESADVFFFDNQPLVSLQAYDGAMYLETFAETCGVMETELAANVWYRVAVEFKNGPAHPEMSLSFRAVNGGIVTNHSSAELVSADLTGANASATHGPRMGVQLGQGASGNGKVLFRNLAIEGMLRHSKRKHQWERIKLGIVSN